VRNVWKGLVVGGLTGVAAGLVLDSASGASRKAAAIGGHVRDHAPEAAHWLHSLSDKAGEWLHESDLPEHIREAAHRIKEADTVQRRAETGDDLVSPARASGDFRIS
jgi:hypothetical protein